RATAGHAPGAFCLSLGILVPGGGRSGEHPIPDRRGDGLAPPNHHPPQTPVASLSGPAFGWFSILPITAAWWAEGRGADAKVVEGLFGALTIRKGRRRSFGQPSDDQESNDGDE